MSTAASLVAMRSDMPQGLRRLGSAAAVSAGALVLLFAAPTAEAAGGRPCQQGTDPASTIDNVTCNVGNLLEVVVPKSPESKPTPTPRATPTATEQAKKNTPKQSSSKTPSSPKGLQGPSKVPSGGGGGGGSAASAPMTGFGGPLLYSGTAPSTTAESPDKIGRASCRERV